MQEGRFLQELNAHHPCNRLRAMSRTNAQLTEEDVRKLRQEILEQEALIRGYQVIMHGSEICHCWSPSYGSGFYSQLS